MKPQRLILNESGQTLVTTMVSLAITSIIALIAVDINSNLVKGQKNSTIYNDIQDLSKQISFSLQDPTLCAQAFGTNAIDINKVMPTSATNDDNYVQNFDVSISAGNGNTDKFEKNSGFGSIFIRSIGFVLTSNDKTPSAPTSKYLGYFRVVGMTGVKQACESATGACTNTAITDTHDLPFRNRKILATILVNKSTKRVESCTSSGFGDQSEAIQAAYQQAATLMKTVLTSDSRGNLLGSTTAWSSAGGAGIPTGALYKKIDYTSTTPPDAQTDKKDCQATDVGPQDQYLVLTLTDPSQADQECAEGKKCSITTPANPPTVPKDIYTCSCKRKVICNFDSYISAN